MISAAHLGALDAGGRTAAVLGTGLLSNYLMKQEPLRKEFLKTALSSPSFRRNGGSKVLLSHEKPHYFGAVPRNGRHSGGREKRFAHNGLICRRTGPRRFALPGHAGETEFAGSNNLIKNGAKPIFSFSDIAEEYSGLFPGKIDLSAGELCRKDKYPVLSVTRCVRRTARFAKKQSKT